MPRRPTEEPKPRVIDQQNRVALPTEVMQALGVERGDYVTFTIDGPHVTIHKVRWVMDKK